MFKNYCVFLFLAFCLLSACKGDKKVETVPVKVEESATAKKAMKAEKAAQKNQEGKTQNSADRAKKKNAKNTKAKGKKSYWAQLAESADFTEDQMTKLEAIDRERREKIKAASDSEKPEINKNYSKKKKDLLGNKLYRAYRDFHKSWITRNN